MMRVLIAIALAASLVGGVTAAPRSVPNKFGKAAGEAFRRAVEAEDAGQISRAIQWYGKSLDLALHPNTAFNLAAVYERNGQFNDAITEYALYLLLAPNAPDAGRVREKIAALEKRPATVTVTLRDGVDPKTVYVLLDGAIIKRPGDLARKRDAKLTFDVNVSRGHHYLQVHTVLGSYFAVIEYAVPGKKIAVEMFENTSDTGNVAAMATSAFRIGRAWDGHGRWAVPPGKQLLAMSYSEIECPPIAIDAPANDDLVSVYIKLLEPQPRRGTDKPAHCPKHEVIRHVLSF